MPRSFLGHLLDNIAERGRDLLPARMQQRNARPSEGRFMALCQDLLSQKGEASGVALAREAIEMFGRLSDDERLAVLKGFATEFGPNPDEIIACAESFKDKPTADTLRKLTRAAEPPRQELFRRLNLSPGGTAFLVHLREQLLADVKGNPELELVDIDLEHLFASWFNRGFLVLERISWQTPASILEKLIRYESVHAIQGWDDLRRRLEADRRCYAFFHPALLDEPLIFVEVALLDHMASQVQEILNADVGAFSAPAATTAVFYSINNCQVGLRGISFGNFLIKQVVEELKKEIPGLTNYVTLSPVPRLRHWLEAEANNLDSEHLMPEDRGFIASAGDNGRLLDPDDGELKEPMMRLAARYLLQAKARGGFPFDPVARFHLGNGARLDRINWRGDLSQKGLKESYGIMVNYAYQLDQIEKNHEAYTNEQTIAASKAVRALAG